MKIVLTLAIGLAAVAIAAGQDAQTADERIVIKKMLSEAEMLGPKASYLGAAVKGAPYSGEEISEDTQVLADGTRIHNESRTTVYRDSEGRVRRETPDGVTIWDPVAKASYFLNPKDQTYHQLPLAVQFFNGSTVRVEVRADGASAGNAIMIAPPPPPPPPPLSGGTGQIFLRTQKMTRRTADQAATESLGRQTVEGLSADGTRQVSTIETGAIGNDRPIQITSERWYSPELQTVVMTRHNDPRSGEETFRLTNVSRGEPPASFFSVPAGYQRLDNK